MIRSLSVQILKLSTSLKIPYICRDQASHGAAAVYGTFMENPGIGTTCMENMEGHRSVN